jgi:hypothetical protein
MYEKFKNIDYSRTKHKVRFIHEVLSDLSSDYERKKARIEDLERQLSIMIIPSKEEVLLADLVVDSIVVTVYNHYADFEITVQNTGLEATVGCLLSVTCSDSVDIINIPALEIGEFFVCHSSFSFDSTTSPISLNVTAVADSSDTIEESNETNNILSQEFIGKSPYILTPGLGGVIVHVHNPEGLEISSCAIDSIGPKYPDYARTFPVPEWSLDGGVTFGNVFPIVRTSSTHNIKSDLAIGSYSVKGRFNSVNSSLQNLVISDGNVSSVVFSIPRDEVAYTMYFETDEFGARLHVIVAKPAAGTRIYWQATFGIDWSPSTLYDEGANWHFATGWYGNEYDPILLTYVFDTALASFSINSPLAGGGSTDWNPTSDVYCTHVPYDFLETGV